MTAAGRLGRLAALLLLLLPALARGWDWSTNVETTFDCETHRNPIQLYKERLYKCEGGFERGAELCTFAGSDIATVEPAVEPAHGDPVGRAFACADGRAYFGAVREPVTRADVRACAATDYPSDADADVQDLLL